MFSYFIVYLTLSLTFCIKTQLKLPRKRNILYVKKHDVYRSNFKYAKQSSSIELQRLTGRNGNMETLY